ncbi:MAG: hypothetical protein LC664_04830 [Flavobacteriales bacterium]|nr:hypothetical protein [Flavobacteriales bacterium]
MTPKNPTTDYFIKLRNGDERQVESKSLEALIENEFESEASFKEKVASVHWKQKSTLCTFNPETGNTERVIADADVNPFGWRQKHR